MVVLPPSAYHLIALSRLHFRLGRAATGVLISAFFYLRIIKAFAHTSTPLPQRSDYLLAHALLVIMP